MKEFLCGTVSVLGRLLLTAIFLMSAVGQKIPKFNETADTMESQGVPIPQVMLAGAIVFLIAGSVSIIVGYRARMGALLLLIFLVLATYFFHDFWNLEGDQKQQQMINFMKNAALMGAMLIIMANGSGAWSLDNRAKR